MRLFLLALGLLGASSLWCASPAQYRAFWVDTFNTRLNSRADVIAAVDAAKSADANALFVQVRRRGDSWYLNSYEPPPDFLPIEPGFDVLHALIEEAHARRIEVHAFVIMGAIWNKNPTFAPTATLGPPTSPEHVFNRHSGFDPSTGRIEPGANNWLTRSLLPDGTAGITFQGHRFGSEFWLDFGHPDAAANSVEVVTHLVRAYNIDGLHLDRIRYPEFTAAGQTPSTGANVGYNAVSVHRFQRRYGIPHDAAPPSPGDALWAQWRRDQVTNVVRRIYLNAIAIRPKIIVSAALIAFGSGPTTEAAWTSAEAYWRVYQDWRAWTEEGILDLAIPMNYKRDAVAQQAGWYDQWLEWTRTHQYNRAALMGLGVYLNPIEATLAQTRRALQALPGVVFYALANPDAAMENNPMSIPPGANTPARGMAEFASALRTGMSVDRQTRYEDASAPVFAEPATIPQLEWKASPRVGHLMGFARRADGTAFDTADVWIYDASGQIVRRTSTDGGGFFGAVDLPPGRYAAVVELGRDRLVSADAVVSVGGVATLRF